MTSSIHLNKPSNKIEILLKYQVKKKISKMIQFMFTLSISVHAAMSLVIQLLILLNKPKIVTQKMGCNPSGSNIMQALMLTLQINH